jgi:hypothetical protein
LKEVTVLGYALTLSLSRWEREPHTAGLSITKLVCQNSSEGRPE